LAAICGEIDAGAVPLFHSSSPTLSGGKSSIQTQISVRVGIFLASRYTRAVLFEISRLSRKLLPQLSNRLPNNRRTGAKRSSTKSI